LPLLLPAMVVVVVKPATAGPLLFSTNVGASGES
jgi:hypothetical protein